MLLVGGPRGSARPNGLVALAALWLVATGVATARAGETVSVREVRQGLFGTCFVNEREGWMVGELGRIFHTADGGTTWERQEIATKRPLLAVSCLDSRTAWTAGKEGIVYGTKDGGATWTQANTGSNRHVFALQFPTPQRGHGVGDFGRMIHTEDGGATWTTAQVPIETKLPDSALDIGVEPGDVNLYGASFGDPDHLWIAGEFGVVLTSADGGRTFTQQHLPIETSLFGIFFADPKNGWAVGIDSVIVRTTDGGVTWAVQHPPVTQRSFYDVAVRGDVGWIVGDSGTVLKSTDRGATWMLEPLPIQLAARWIRSISLVPGGKGFAVGAEGLAFRMDGPRLERLGSRERTS
jgi:photosystem II stability/assembly factor-like uncharacterized protein